MILYHGSCCVVTQKAIDSMLTFIDGYKVDL